MAPIFNDYLTGQERYWTLSDDVEYVTGLVQELHRQPGTIRANIGEFIGDYGWTRTNDNLLVPGSEVRFRARLATHGPWPGLTPAGVEWDPTCINDYRETLSIYRRGTFI